MTLSEYQQIFTSNVAKLLTYSEALGFAASIREVQRTEYQEAEYVRTGKSKGMESNHLDSLAADIYFFKDGKLCEKKEDTEVLGKYWESLYPKNRWGGHFKSLQDCPHFELNRD